METSVSLLDRLAGTPTDDDWRKLLDLYLPLLRAWMARAGVPSSDADDLSQDVLLVVFREVGGFERRGRGAFRAWLRTILVNRMRDYFRARQHRPAATGGSDFLRRSMSWSHPAGAESPVGPGARRACRRVAAAPGPGRFRPGDLASVSTARPPRRAGRPSRRGTGPVAEFGGPRQEPRSQAGSARVNRPRRVSASDCTISAATAFRECWKMEDGPIAALANSRRCSYKMTGAAFCPKNDTRKPAHGELQTPVA